MSFLSLMLMALALSMDAFAVAVCKGLAMKRITLKGAITVGLWFGIFQALMPLLGYLFGTVFGDSVRAVDHWVAFILLGFIGGKMIHESFSKDDKPANDSLLFLNMLGLAVATSIDALAAGITFAFLNVNIVNAVTLIGITTFVLSAVGVKLGNVFGVKYKSRAEFAGGVVLVALGIKILLEHLFNF